MTTDKLLEFFDRARRERRIFENVPVFSLAVRHTSPAIGKYSLPLGSVAGVKVKIEGQEVFVPRRQLTRHLPDAWHGHPCAGVPEGMTVDLVITKVEPYRNRLSVIGSKVDAIRVREERFFESASVGKKYRATVVDIYERSLLGRSFKTVVLTADKVRLEMRLEEVSDDAEQAEKLATPGTTLDVITTNVSRKASGTEVEVSAKRRLLVPYGQAFTGTVISDTHDSRPVSYRFGEHEKRDRLVEITDGVVTAHVHVPFDKCGNHYFSRKGDTVQVEVNPLGDHLIGRILFKSS